MVYFLGQVEIYTKETMKMNQETDMAKCIGLMEAFTKANGLMESNMDQVIFY